MSTLIEKHKYWPIALALPLAFAGIILAKSSGSNNLNVGTGQDAQTGSALGDEDPKVTINGKEVDLGSDGEGTLRTDGATVNVSGDSATVNSTGGKTVITNQDGSVDITVESNSNSNSSSTKIDYDSDSDFHWENDSSIKVKQKGEGSIQVSD